MFAIAMDELDPIPEKPRFLLPDGCKDLVDVIQRQKDKDQFFAELPFASGSGKIDFSKFPAGSPKTIELPDSITVVELAKAIHVPLLHLLVTLARCGIDTALSQPLDFRTARRLCALYGVEANRAD